MNSKAHHVTVRNMKENNVSFWLLQSCSSVAALLTVTSPYRLHPGTWGSWRWGTRGRDWSVSTNRNSSSSSNGIPMWLRRQQYLLKSGLLLTHDWCDHGIQGAPQVSLDTAVFTQQKAGPHLWRGGVDKLKFLPSSSNKNSSKDEHQQVDQVFVGTWEVPVMTRRCPHSGNCYSAYSTAGPEAPLTYTGSRSWRAATSAQFSTTISVSRHSPSVCGRVGRCIHGCCRWCDCS